jgi:hypothetical protein
MRPVALQSLVPEKRADTLLHVMQYIEWYTLQRAWDRLTDDEFFWEPVGGAWGVRLREECPRPTPFGAGDWVVDFDLALVSAGLEGNAVEPMPTIGWWWWAHRLGARTARTATAVSVPPTGVCSPDTIRVP